jgi:hypothetical protein
MHEESLDTRPEEDRSYFVVYPFVVDRSFADLSAGYHAVKYETFGEAEAEAITRANKNPDTLYYVLQAVAKVVADVKVNSKEIGV